GEKANQVVNNLASQASSKGIPVKLSDIINLKVNIGGSITSPSIKTDLKDAGSSLAQDIKDQANQFVEAKKAAADSAVAAAKQATKDSIASAKNQVISGLKDELGKQLSGQKDSTGEKKDIKKGLEETGKGLINNILKKKKKDTDSTKQ
ncbi:MAG: hypothetical protein DI539_29975, partial [Flavobacterium psychrophilum]